MWPVFVLGHRFSGLVAIQPGHTLVTSGIYSLLRHPSYLGLFVDSLGWASLFALVLAFCSQLSRSCRSSARIRAEEALLHSQFGAGTTPTAAAPHACSLEIF